MTQYCDTLQYGHLMTMCGMYGVDTDVFWNRSPREIIDTVRWWKPLEMSKINEDMKKHDACEWVTGLQKVAESCHETNMKLCLSFEDFPCRMESG